MTNKKTNSEQETISQMGRRSLLSAYFQMSDKPTTTACSSASSAASSPCPITRKLSWLRTRTDRSSSWASDTSPRGSGGDKSPRPRSGSSTAGVGNISRAPHRFSVQSLFGGSAGASSDSSLLSEESRIVQLERAIVDDEEFCDELIAALLGAHVFEGHLKVRFVEAVSDFEVTVDRRQRLAKGAKIIMTFARRSSRFKIQSLSVKTRMGDLSQSKQQILSELLAEPVVNELLLSSQGDEHEMMEDLKLI